VREAATPPESEEIVAYESQRLRLIGTRQVTLSVFELKLSDEDSTRMAGDLVGTVTEILEAEGQTVNGVLVADQAMAEDREASPTDIIFFPPDLGTPIVCHVESPPMFESRWVITGTGA
jgi:hypothetical protein